MILIGIGANLPAADGAPPLESCRRAALALDALPGLRLRGLSRWYETVPMLATGPAAGAQPRYINGVAHLVAGRGMAMDPAWLLRHVLALETAAGRVRSVANAARVLDLDVIAIGDLVRAAPDPVLPHPRAHQRAFVLLPLAEVAPGWVHPVLGHNAAAMLATLPPQGARVL